MRTPIIAGNWKMNKTAAEASELVAALIQPLAAIQGVSKVLCPPFFAVPEVARLVQGTDIGVGAQDLFWEPSGAYTGEVSPEMVREFCDYVIVGHSERRQYFGETDATVNRKIMAALRVGLTPIVCVGETLELRESGQTESWVTAQVKGALEGISGDQVAEMVIAYEPIWAIGTGLAATAEDAQRVIGDVVRDTVKSLYASDVSEAVRIQYGGSVKPANAEEIMSKPDIDGGLIGGASLKAADFGSIVQLSAKAKGIA